MYKKTINLVMTSLAFAAMLLMVTPTVHATTVYDLTSDHCTSPCGPQTLFGTVSVTTITTGDVQVTVTLNNNNKFVNTGFSGTIDFNLIGTPTISVTGLPANWSLVSTTAGSQSMDGLGQFDYAILWGSQGGGAADGSTITFDVHGDSITAASFAKLSQIPPGSDASFFGVDIISGTTGNTGPIDAHTAGHPPQQIPEPSTLLLLGAGLFAVSLIARKSRLGQQN
jgi:PEP-CTERM motif-containing protein